MNAKSHAVYVISLLLLTPPAFSQSSSPVAGKPATPDALGIAFIDGATSTLLLERDGKKYIVDITAHTVREVNAAANGAPAAAESSSAAQPTNPAPDTTPKARVYHPGDDVVFSLPSGRRTQRHGLYVNFSHRFPEEPAFHGRARGHELLGLDSFAVPSFGFRYGVTSHLAVSAYRSPFSQNRVIELGASYFLADEQSGAPLNLVVRASFDGQNDFQRNFSSNFELIAARSAGSHTQFYLVPTVSLHNRPLIAGFNPLHPPPYLRCSTSFVATGVGKLKPCANTFSLGLGLSVDVRKTVALFAEVNPTLVNARDLGVHRPPYSFGIQKKIWRHAFAFGFTTAPGTTASQRSGTRATLLQNANADKPSGLFIGFNLTRQLR